MKKNMKNIFIILLIFLMAILIFIGFKFLKLVSTPTACPLDAKLCPDGSSVGRVLPNCEFSPCPGEKEGILVSAPQRNAEISSPLEIKGKAKGFWFFEAQFSAKLFDENNQFLGETILKALDNWMTEDYVDFEGELVFKNPSTQKGILKFFSANPSGLEENQKFFEVPVSFKKISNEKMKVLLYYYNPEKDKDESKNILCSEKGLVPIEREIPISPTPIKDTLILFLKGKENLTQEEIKQGITTELPLKGLKLIDLNLKNDGTLVVRFDDPFNQTSGGSCRVRILWSQIEATLKQFPQVKRVQFLPEELFQP